MTFRPHASVNADRALVLDRLADEPLHVEARGLLLCRPDASVLLDRTDRDALPGRNGLVFTAEHGMAIGFGAPSVSMAEDLRELADESGMAQEGVELHLPTACAVDWLALEGATSLGEHRVQVLGAAVESAHLEALIQHEFAVLTSRKDPRLQTLPRALRAEFSAMHPWPVVVAALAGGCIASIASAFVETEGYFDVSIDTITDFRRAGFGVGCAAALIEVERERGKRPVWMVREKNRASLALSEKLGFQDVGRVQGLLLH